MPQHRGLDPKLGPDLHLRPAAAFQQGHGLAFELRRELVSRLDHQTPFPPVTSVSEVSVKPGEYQTKGRTPAAPSAAVPSGSSRTLAEAWPAAASPAGSTDHSSGPHRAPRRTRSVPPAPRPSAAGRSVEDDRPGPEPPGPHTRTTTPNVDLSPASVVPARRQERRNHATPRHAMNFFNSLLAVPTHVEFRANLCQAGPCRYPHRSGAPSRPFAPCSSARPAAGSS
jgi:hypothetical protein